MTYTYILQLPDGKLADCPMDRDDDKFVLKHNKGAKIKKKIAHDVDRDEPNFLTRCVNLALGTDF